MSVSQHVARATLRLLEVKARGGRGEERRGRSLDAYGLRIIDVFDLDDMRSVPVPRPFVWDKDSMESGFHEIDIAHEKLIESISRLLELLNVRSSSSHEFFRAWFNFIEEFESHITSETKILSRLCRRRRVRRSPSYSPGLKRADELVRSAEDLLIDLRKIAVDEFETIAVKDLQLVLEAAMFAHISGVSSYLCEMNEGNNTVITLANNNPETPQASSPTVPMLPPLISQPSRSPPTGRSGGAFTTRTARAVVEKTIGIFVKKAFKRKSSVVIEEPSITRSSPPPVIFEEAAASTRFPIDGDIGDSPLSILEASPGHSPLSETVITDTLTLPISPYHRRQPSTETWTSSPPNGNVHFSRPRQEISLPSIDIYSENNAVKPKQSLRFPKDEEEDCGEDRTHDRPWELLEILDGDGGDNNANQAPASHQGNFAWLITKPLQPPTPTVNQTSTRSAGNVSSCATASRLQSIILETTPQSRSRQSSVAVGELSPSRVRSTPPPPESPSRRSQQRKTSNNSRIRLPSLDGSQFGGNTKRMVDMDRLASWRLKDEDENCSMNDSEQANLLPNNLLDPWTTQRFASITSSHSSRRGTGKSDYSYTPTTEDEESMEMVLETNSFAAVLIEFKNFLEPVMVRGNYNLESLTGFSPWELADKPLRELLSDDAVERIMEFALERVNTVEEHRHALTLRGQLRRKQSQPVQCMVFASPWETNFVLLLKEAKVKFKEFKQAAKLYLASEDLQQSLEV